MSLTKKSEKLIKHFIDDFDKYCIKKTADIQKTTDTVLKLVYRDIRHSVNYMRLIKKHDLLLTDVKKINGSLNKLLKTKRSTNMFMNTKKFEKKFKFRLPKIRDEILSEAKNYF